MKKFTSLLTLALIAATSFSFVSCEEHYYDDYYYDDWGYYDDGYRRNNDDRNYFLQLVQTLRGQWEGTIHTKYVDDDYRVVEGDYFTEFQFDYTDVESFGGRGQETDYEGDNLVYQESFTWYIDTKSEDLILEFDSGRRMIVDEYHLDKNKFSGSMYSKETGEENTFSLSRYTYANENNTFEAEDGAAPAKAKAKKSATGTILGGGHKN